MPEEKSSLSLNERFKLLETEVNNESYDKEKIENLLQSLYSDMEGQFLLKNQASYLRTCLHKAIKKQHYKATFYILNIGGLGTRENYYEKDSSFLHETVYNNDHEITELFLEKGARVNEIDYQGYTPLDYAYIFNTSETIKNLLIEKGATFNKYSSPLIQNSFLNARSFAIKPASNSNHPPSFPPPSP